MVCGSMEVIRGGPLVDAHRMPKKSLSNSTSLSLIQTFWHLQEFSTRWPGAGKKKLPQICQQLLNRFHKFPKKCFPTPCVDDNEWRKRWNNAKDSMFNVLWINVNNIGWQLQNAYGNLTPTYLTTCRASKGTHSFSILPQSRRVSDSIVWLLSSVRLTNLVAITHWIWIQPQLNLSLTRTNKLRCTLFCHINFHNKLPVGTRWLASAKTLLAVWTIFWGRYSSSLWYCFILSFWRSTSISSLTTARYVQKIRDSVVSI